MIVDPRETRRSRVRNMAVVILAAAFVLAGRAIGDEVELTNGIRIEGKVTARTETAVTIHVDVGDEGRDMTYPLSKVRAITVAGKREALGGAADEKPAAADEKPVSQVPADLKKDTTPDFRFIRLCIENGDNRRAVALINGVVGDGRRDTDYLNAGDRFVKAGVFAAAEHCYEMALNAPGSKSWDGNQRRARRALVDLFCNGLATNLERVPDGSYRAVARGFCGPVGVAVDVRGGRIQAVRIIQTTENRAKTSLTDMPAGIVNKQGLRGVDAVTGATISSNAVLIAAGKALKGAERPASQAKETEK